MEVVGDVLLGLVEPERKRADKSLDAHAAIGAPMRQVAESAVRMTTCDVVVVIGWDAAAAR